MKRLLFKRGKSEEIDSIPNAIVSCPFANTEEPVDIAIAHTSGCPFHAHILPPQTKLLETPELKVESSKYVTTLESASLIKDIGGGDRIREGCTRFYARAFEDYTLSPFMTVESDGAEAHGKRLADWIIEKMGGEGTPWADSGRKGIRQITHVKAWNSPAREPRERGKHFKLDDCIIWMRLHFYAMREVGLDQYPAFWSWYKQFISHFIAVYERQAPPYTESAANWSLGKVNLDEYKRNNNKMLDVIGMGR